MLKEAYNGKVVSNDGPKEDEKRHEALLQQWVTTTIEPEEEFQRRRSVLSRINILVTDWICQTMITDFRMPESAAKQISGRIFATGSYRYNVHTSGSDIDIVLIAPARITRDHFFNSLAPKLKNEPWVKDLYCIRDTRVPIIAMVCDGIDIDLSFGAIRQDCVPEEITDDLLHGLDEQSVLSCNAVRVAHEIIRSVPPHAISSFRQTLRFVKAWGKRRGIYSNTFGFPSGIGWAILVAFVSQCYPNQNAAGLVIRFFRTYNTWFKPNPREGSENRAIYLTPSMRAKTPLGRCWDPRESRSDAKALFPVLTPALPYGNACFNVTLTNLKQLCAEFKRGHELTTQYLGLSPVAATAKFGAYGIWSKLLEPAEFFGAYNHYMHIQISCHDPELYQAYIDGVESKIRILWSGNASSRGHTLENISQLKLRLNPKRYEDPEETERRSQWLKKPTTSSLPQSARTSARESGTIHSLRNSTAAGNTFLAAPTRFTSTAHYFIGMEVDTRISSDPIDLSPSIKVFHQVVEQLRQFKKGTTELPVIQVCDVNGVPAFVLCEAGYTPTPAGSAQNEAPGEGDNSTSESVHGDSDSTNHMEDGPHGDKTEMEASNDKIGMKREREVTESEKGGSSFRAAPVPSIREKETAGIEEMDLEEALGLDF